MQAMVKTLRSKYPMAENGTDDVRSIDKDFNANSGAGHPSNGTILRALVLLIRITDGYDAASVRQRADRSSHRIQVQVARSGDAGAQLQLAHALGTPGRPPPQLLHEALYARAAQQPRRHPHAPRQCRRLRVQNGRRPHAERRLVGRRVARVARARRRLTDRRGRRRRMRARRTAARRRASGRSGRAQAARSRDGPRERRGRAGARARARHAPAGALRSTALHCGWSAGV